MVHVFTCNTTLHSPPPPLPVKPGGKATGSDDFRYFSTEQVRMLAEMFKQVVGMKEEEGSAVTPRRVASQLSSSDLSKQRAKVYLYYQLLS